MDNLERQSIVRYELYSPTYGNVVIQQPRKWGEDTISYERKKDSRRIEKKVLVDLEFFGDGAEMIKNIHLSRGVQEKVLITKFERDSLSLSEQFKVRYVQQLDMGTYKRNSKTGNVTIKATEGGLATDIDNRKSDKYDLINDESADGINIGAIQTESFTPQPRGILLESLLEDTQTGYRVNSERYKENLTDVSRSIPLTTTYSSDQENVQGTPISSVGYNTITHNQNYAIGTSQPINDNFFYRADRAKRIKVKIGLSFKIEQTDYKDTDNEKAYVEIRRSNHVGGSDILIEPREVLFTTPGNPQNEIGIQRDINEERTFDLLEGESLSIVFLIRAFMDVPAFSFRTAKLDTYFTVLKSSVLVTDQTDYPLTTSRCIKPFNLFERIIAKITGKRYLFASSLFEVGGKYEYMVCDSGFWARGFPDSYIDSDDEERTIQFNTSFKDAFDAFNYLEPLAWFVDLVGNKQVIRIETAKHTMQNFIGVNLNAVDDIVHESSKPDYFSNINIGHKHSLEYEEINGLDEPNGASEFNSHIKLNDSKYIVSSPYRFDAIGYELIRRIQFVNKPKEDTERDSHIWIHDAKRLGSDYITHKLWGDRFDSAPTGVFDPNTAWNLWLSPMNRTFYGHGYSFKRGLYHFPKDKVRFSSSNANENLKTTYNGLELSEKGSILVGDIETPRIEANKTTLTFKMTQEIENQLQGYTKIGDKYIPNYFGLIEYTEKGEVLYGRLSKLDSKNDSKLVMQNARL